MYRFLSFCNLNIFGERKLEKKEESKEKKKIERGRERVFCRYFVVLLHYMGFFSLVKIHRDIFVCGTVV